MKKKNYNTRKAILFIGDIKVIVKENTLSNKQTKGIREIIKIVKYQNVRQKIHNISSFVNEHIVCNLA